jgi:hypothetical protein
MRFGRKEFIAGGAMAVGAVGLVVGEYKLEKSIAERSERVKNIANFFRGKETKATLKIFNRELNYEALAKILQTAVTPPIKTLTQTKELMFAFADMIEVEDKFDKPYNSAPLLEQTDQAVEAIAHRNVPITASFGYSQINPFTALRLASANKDSLGQSFSGMSAQLQKFQGRSAEKILDKEIVDALDLSGNGNLVFGFQAFYEVYNIYGRDAQGNLHTNRQEDPRVFSLAVAGYSGTPLTPITAKIQAMAREASLYRHLNNSDSATNLLSVDGALGKQTKTAVLGEFPDGVQTQMVQFDQARGLEAKLLAWEGVCKAVKTEWQQKFSSLLTELRRSKDPEVIALLLAGRYSAINSLDGLLNQYAGAYTGIEKTQKLAKIKEMYEAFFVSRDPALLNLVRNEQAFNQVFPEYYHSEFLDAVLNLLEGSVKFDNRYKGVIPTGFIKRRFADDINIARRVALGHKIKDANEVVKILPKTPVRPKTPPRNNRKRPRGKK